MDDDAAVGVRDIEGLVLTKMGPVMTGMEERENDVELDGDSAGVGVPETDAELETDGTTEEISILVGVGGEGECD